MALAGRKGRGENVGTWDRHHRPLSLLHLLSRLLPGAIKQSPNRFFLSLATRLSRAGCVHGAELSAHRESDSSRFQLGRGGASPCCAATAFAPWLFWGVLLAPLPCCGGGGGTIHLPHASKSQREWGQHRSCATWEPDTSLSGISVAIGWELLLPRLLSLGCPRGSAQPRCYLCAAAPAGIPRHPDKNKHLNVKAAAWRFVAMFGGMSLSADKNIAAANLE